MRFTLPIIVIAGVVVGGAAACGSSSNAKASAGTSGGTGAGSSASSSSESVGSSSSGSTTSSSASSAGGTTGTTVAPASGHTTGCGPTETPTTGGFPFPPVVASGGALLSPSIVSVVFAGETDGPSLAAFGDALASTCYWDVIRAGYCEGSTCVGDGPSGTTIQLSTPAAASYTDPAVGGGTLQTFLQGLITAGTVPAPGANTLYMLYFPASTSIDMDGSKSCRDFDGYHGNFQVGSQNVDYAVIPECAAPMMTPQITTLQNTTITGSHEAIEASTDGDYMGFYLDLNQESTFGWNDVQGGEVADLCVDPFLLGLDEFTENGFVVQRSWSVTNATAGKNPCVPIPQGEVYFNAFPKDSVLVMDVGASKTIEVDALADGTMPAWTVLPQDWTDPTTQYLSYSIAGGTTGDGGPSIQMASGDKIMLTVTLLADPTNTQNGEADGVIVSANAIDPDDVTAAHFWPFVVLTTATANDAGITMMKRAHHSHARGRGQLTSRPRRARNVFGGFR